MATIQVLAVTGRRLPDAQALVFEYMATTQREAGRTVPAHIHQLPSVLRDECTNLATAYQPPGTLLLAYRNHEPIGCVGLKPMPPPGTIEIKRLYVRAAHRGAGVARMLMQHAHRHAAHHGFNRLVLDVMPTRTRVIDFYRRMGYTDAEPFPTEAPDPMVYMQRLI
jgi:ribosomal protein S18 acetylase RimI-like enzyme